MVTIAQLRSTFLDFFAQRGHTVVESASLLPKGDATLLFVNSGMVPFTDCFRGTETRPYTRAASCQKSLRVSGKHNDYEQIGQTARHHTFFEMLGNFSLGDYFKEDAIRFAWELVTEVLKLPKSLLWVTVHHKDDEAAELWQKVAGVSPDRIVRLGDDSNLWAMGEYGPRGYSSEIFYYTGDKPESQSVEEFLKDDGTYIEFWNLVFMQFNRNLDGSVIPLPKPCIDTGAGLERLAYILQGVKSNYDTNEIRALIAKVEEISGVRYDGSSYDRTKMGEKQWEIDVAMRVIADHARAIAFLMADGVAPSNEKEGYVLRRLIRRSTLRGSGLGIQDNFLSLITDEVVNMMGAAYPELRTHAERIRRLTLQEEAQFKKTLAGGLKVLSEAVQGLAEGAVLSGDVAFKLHDTYGFPLDLTEDVLREKRITADRERFEKLMEEQRERSRVAPKGVGAAGGSLKDLHVEGGTTRFIGYDTLSSESQVQAILKAAGGKADSPEIVYIVVGETPFYPEMGGQVGDRGVIRIAGAEFDVLDTQRTHSGHIIHVSAPRAGTTVHEGLLGETAFLDVDRELRTKVAQNHSGTHLLNAALRSVLGSHVEQRGSLVSADKLRFDFAHSQPVTPDELHRIQTLVNAIIRENHEVVTVEMPVAEAKARGAVAAFGEKYGESVRVVEMGPLSMELCGGTHVKRTGDIGFSFLLSEGSIATGVRRIEAVSAERALSEFSRLQDILTQMTTKIRGTVAELPGRIDALQEQTVSLASEVKEKNSVIATLLSESLAARAQSVNDSRNVVSQVTQDIGRDALMMAAEKTLAKIGKGTVVLAHAESGSLAVMVSRDNADAVNAGALVKEIATTCGGKGGGKPQSATLVNIPRAEFDHALQFARQKLGMTA